MATMTRTRPATQPAQRAATHYALLAAAVHEFNPARAQALVVLSCAGLQLSDLVSLDVGSLCDLEAAGRMGYHVMLRSGARVSITASTYSVLINYVCRTARLGDPASPLFLSRRQHRLSTKQVRRILASVASRAGVGQAF